MPIATICLNSTGSALAQEASILIVRENLPVPDNLEFFMALAILFPVNDAQGFSLRSFSA